MDTVYFDCDDKDLFVCLGDGTKIAKRGHRNTPEAKTWISLHPNYTVKSNEDHRQMTIEVLEAA